MKELIKKATIPLIGMCFCILSMSSTVKAVSKQIELGGQIITVVVDNELKYSETWNENELKKHIMIYNEQGENMEFSVSEESNNGTQEISETGNGSSKLHTVGYKEINVNITSMNHTGIYVEVFCNGYIVIGYGSDYGYGGDKPNEILNNKVFIDPDAIDEPVNINSNKFYNMGFAYEQCSNLSQIYSIKPVKKNQYFKVEYSFNKKFKKIFATGYMCIPKGEQNAYFTKFDIKDKKCIEVDYKKMQKTLSPLFFPKKKFQEDYHEGLKGTIYARFTYLGKKGITLTDASTIKTYKMYPKHNSIVASTWGSYFDFSANGTIMLNKDKDFNLKKNKKLIDKISKKIKKNQSVYYVNNTTLFYYYIVNIHFICCCF